jgi:WD40 repeat protein
LASGSAERTIKIWNQINGTLIRTLNGHTDYVLALTDLQNGDLARGSADRTINI